jgi:hypothetical protein
MDALAQYAGQWLREARPPTGQRGWGRLLRATIQNTETARPGFASALRLAALDELRDTDPIAARKTIAILAIVGTAEDVPTLRALASNQRGLVDDVRTAVCEIEEREVLAQRPRLPPGVSPLRDRIGHWVVRTIAGAAVIAGLAAAVRVHGIAPRLLALLAGFGSAAGLMQLAREAEEGGADQSEQPR